VEKKGRTAEEGDVYNRAIIVQRMVAAEVLNRLDNLLQRHFSSSTFHKAIVPKHFTHRVRASVTP
jgi:hypothetical protein